MPQLTIDARFNGPPDSGNGGYVCGLVAGPLDGPAEVTLHRPPPLSRALTLNPGSATVTLEDGDAVVASAIAKPLELELPEAPSFDEAVQASRSFPGHQEHAFPTCFVCGPGRPANDGMDIFPGAIGDAGVVASPWTPDASMPNDGGRIRDEVVWAALDCTSYFPHNPAVAVLGRMHAQRTRDVFIEEEYVVVGWRVGREGRKLWSASAVFGPDGRACAMARATWILLKQEQRDFDVAKGAG